MARSKFTRREFLQIAGFTGGAAVLAACAPQVVTQVVNQTQVVSQTQVVTQVVAQTQVVNQTQIVQVPVTTTPLPAIVTPQGRELPPDAAPLDKQVSYGVGREPKHFDPTLDIYTAVGQNTSTEPLLHYNENFELVPALAESWKAGPNAEYWEFVIRKDAVWSDGTPFTADDIVYTYRHLSDPANGNTFVAYFFVVKGVQAFNSGTGTADGVGVTKIDDRTVQIAGQNGPSPVLPALLSYQAAVFVPKHLAEKNPTHWADTIEGYVSYGPYIPTKWEHNKDIVWEINPTYNGFNKPGIQTLHGLIYAAGAVPFNSWLNKEIDYIPSLGPAELAAVRADPKLNALLHFFSNFESRYVVLNVLMPPLDNLDFRKALAHSIDRDVLAQQLFAGTELPGYSMLPPGFPAYNPDLKQYQVFDLDQAKAALAKSGVDPAKVTLDLYINTTDRYLEYVAQQWETNLGIKSKLTVLDNGVWSTKRADHSMQVFRAQYEYDFVDASNMLDLFRSVPAPEGKKEPWGSPRHAWKNDAFDKLDTDASVEADAAKRLQLFQDAEKLLVDDVGAIFLLHQVIFQIWWPWIVGVPADKTGTVIFRDRDITPYQVYVHKDVDAMRAASY